MNDLNQLKNASRLENYTLEKDEVMCFKNHSVKLYFTYFPKTLEPKSSGAKLPLEADIWPIIGDLLNYLHDLSQLNLHNGDL